MRDDGQGRRRDCDAAIDELGEGVIRGSIRARGRGVGIGAHRTGRQGGGNAASGARDSGGDEVLAVHETGERGGVGRIGGAVFARRIRTREGQGGLVDGQRTGGEVQRVVCGGKTARCDGVAAGVDRALAVPGEGERASQDIRGLVVTEATEDKTATASEGRAVVGLGGVARGDGQACRTDGERRRIGGILCEDVVTRGGSEPGDVDAILPHSAGGGDVGRKDEGSRGGGREAFTILEAGHGRGEGRIGGTVFA